MVRSAVGRVNTVLDQTRQRTHWPCVFGLEFTALALVYHARFPCSDAKESIMTEDLPILALVTVHVEPPSTMPRTGLSEDERLSYSRSHAASWRRKNSLS
jgi:hypothetical protein